MHTDTATSRQLVGGVESYFIRSGHRGRDRVEYFLDEMDYAGLTRSDDPSTGLSTQLLLVGAAATKGEQR